MLHFTEHYRKGTVGLWFFVTEDEARYSCGKSVYGFGCIKYDEGSVYTGDIWFDGKNYHKFGFGKQDFTYSEIGSANSLSGKLLKAKKYMFVGEFDHRVNNWIYGNGVLYYNDLNGNPYRFMKGKFNCLTRTGDWDGEFDYSSLLDGFTPDMEWIVDERLSLFKSQLENKTKIGGKYNLFIGDSFFELWNSTEYTAELFRDYYPEKANLNLGVGGSTFEDWKVYLEYLGELPAPNKIFINLGFNDVHYGTPTAEIAENFRYVADGLKKYFPSAAIYVFTSVHAPKCEGTRPQTEEWNSLLKSEAEKAGVAVVDACAAFESRGDRSRCFYRDGVHPDTEGYRIYRKLLQKVLD